MNGSEPGAASRPYFYTVVGLGFAAAVYAGYRLFAAGASYPWLPLSLLTIPASAFALRLPAVKAKISISDVIIYTCILLFGTAAGALTAALDGLVGSLRCRTSSRRLEFMSFNIACMTLSASLGGKAFFFVARAGTIYPLRSAASGKFLLGLLAMTLIYYLVNSLLVACMVALDQSQNVFEVWNRQFLWAIVNNIAASSFAGAVTLTVGAVTPLSCAAILVVLVLVFFSIHSHIRAASNPERGS